MVTINDQYLRFGSLKKIMSYNVKFTLTNQNYDEVYFIKTKHFLKNCIYKLNIYGYYGHYVNSNLYLFGDNEYGQLGRKDKDSRESMDYENYYFLRNYCFAVNKNFDTYSWGYNKDGQLGIGNFNNQFCQCKLRYRFKKLIFIENNTMGITIDNEIYVWGKNNNGELGLHNKRKQCWPVKLTIRINMFLYENLILLPKYQRKINVWKNLKNKNKIDIEFNFFQRK